MTQSPSFYVNSPVSGTQYWSKLWCGAVGASGDTLDAHVLAWTGANGTGSLIVVTTLQAWVWDFSTGTSFVTHSDPSVNSEHTSSGGATAGHVYQVSGKYTGSGVGSLEFYLIYTTSSAFVPTTPTFSPSVGAPGTHVTVSGSRFTDATIVKFNGVNAASFSITNDTTIDAVVPSGSGVGPILVGNPAGNSPNSASNFFPGVLERRKAGVWQPFELDIRRTGAWSYALPQRRSTTNWNVGG